MSLQTGTDYRSLSPAESYVVSVQADGREIDDILDLTDGRGAHVDILVSAKGAEINGHVRDGDPETRVALWRGEETEARHALTDAEGNFSFRSLGPGVYHLIALDNADLIPSHDEVTWRALESRTTRIVVREGARERVVLSRLVE